MLTPSDIHLMRTTVERAMPGTAVIYSLAGSADGMGGQIDTQAPSGTVSARLDYLSGSEAEIASRIAERASYVLTVPHDTAIAESGEVVYATVRYQVTAVLPLEPWDLCQRAYLTRIG
jgi:hypothetical protein